MSRGGVRLADYVGLEVDYETSSCERCRGTIVRATYSMFGEPVVVLHQECRPSQTAGEIVVYGPAASAILQTAAGLIPAA